MTALNWLHLTDRHAGQQDFGLWQNVKDAVLKDLRKLGRHQQQTGRGPWDVVLYTGDLAFSGEKAQYDKLSSELDEIWEVLREPWPDAPPPILLAVPGNHDLCRPEQGDPVAAALQNEEKSRELLFKKQPRMIADVSAWFANYSAWWENCKHRPQRDLQKGLLPGEFSYVLDKDGVRFGFVGINTAFLDLWDGSYQKLWMDVRQLHEACGGSLPDFLKKCDHAFLLTHHPPDWLSPRAQQHYRAEIAHSGFTAHFCGHLHEAYAYEHSLGFSEQRRLWQGVSLFGLEKLPGKELERKHGYTAGHMAFAEQIPRVTLWPRVALKRQDGSWRLTADYSFALENDLAHTPPQPVSGSVRSVNLKAETAPLASAPLLLEDKPQSWRETAEACGLWKATEGKAEAVEPLRQLAGEIAETCWQTWHEVERVLPHDPWRDSDHPRRVLARATHLLGEHSIALTPAETFTLTIAPFLHSAVRACGVRWMADADPNNLSYTSASTEPRNTLEQVHLARPDLVRRAERLQGVDRQGVVLWMMYRALDRTSTLWEARPRLPLVQRLALRVRESAESAGVRWVTWENLVSLARCIGASPDLLDGEQGIARSRREEVLEKGARRRVAALAYFLCVAGWSALDPCLADEAAVDHVGLDASFRSDDVRAAFAQAQWSTRHDEHVLSHACRHPVIDFVLRELVERADEILKRIRQHRDDEADDLLRPLHNLPARLSSANIHPAHDPTGRPLYRLPHIRFRLDHNRVRELLMGEQLYGDPTLAVRELYQNALDACRYRQARQGYLQHLGNWFGAPYQGRIILSQATDPLGRPYIECVDNGVGMTEYELERIFAVAGRRFADTPDFLEERAAWRRCVPPIELYPNSQFGIGVLSYFMLADELEITTRRFQRNGVLGPLLVVQISSASGLFRLTERRDENVLPEGGSQIRLYLGKETYENNQGKRHALRVRAILDEFLRVAEFETAVYDQESPPRRWLPGTLYHPDSSQQYTRTADPDVWWSASAGDEAILADGVTTETKIPMVVVNLRGPRYPKLSIDRRSIIAWDSKWLPAVLERSWQQLLEWSELTLEYLWKLELHHPEVARKVFRTLVDRDAEIRVWSNRKDRVKLKDVGCFAYDLAVLSGRDASASTPMNTKYLDWHAETTLPNAVHRWRLLVWEQAGLIRNSGLPPLARANQLKALLAEPEDWKLIDSRAREYPGDQRWISLRRLNAGSGIFLRNVTTHVLELLQVARARGLPAGEVLARFRQFQPLGAHIRGQEESLSLLEELGLDDNDFLLLSKKLNGASPWLSKAIPAIHTLLAARRLSLSPEAIGQRLAQLAPVLNLPLKFSLASLQGLELDEQDWQILILVLSAEGPWLSREHGGIKNDWGRFLDTLHVASDWFSETVHALRVLTTARYLSLPVETVIRRLSRLTPALNLSFAFDPASIHSLELDETDWILLSLNLTGEAPWLSETVPAMHVLAAARRLSLSPDAVFQRLARLAPTLGLSMKFAPESLQTLELEGQDWLLLSHELNGQSPWLERTVSAVHVLVAAHRFSLVPEAVAQRIAQLAPALGLSLEFALASFAPLELTQQDWRLLSQDLDGRAPWRTAPLTALQLLRAASILNASITELGRRAQALRILSPEVDLVSLEAKVNAGSITRRDFDLLLSCFNEAGGEREFILALARHRIWWLTDEQLQEAITALLSLLPSDRTERDAAPTEVSNASGR